MVQLGLANSRMKDFYDVALLARDFEFDGDLLVRAIKATFERRRTPLPTAVPVAFTTDFAADASKQAQWSGFVRRAAARDAGTLAEVIAAVAAFAERPLRAAAGIAEPPSFWRTGGPWR